MPEKGSVSVGRLVLVPGLITLAVTLLRLVGELNDWSPLLFSRAAGGGGAVIGIVWLVFVFAFYFAWKLVQAGETPAGRYRALGHGALGILITAAFAFGATLAGLPLVGQFAAFVVGSLAGLAVAYRAWPALGRVLVAYGFAARVPVAVIMLFAIFGNWGTHYDVLPPNATASLGGMSPFGKWLMIGLLPQLTIWIGFTVAVGMLCGGLLVALRPHRVTATA
jgi:hypothetical protein